VAQCIDAPFRKRVRGVDVEQQPHQLREAPGGQEAWGTTTTCTSLPSASPQGLGGLAGGPPQPTTSIDQPVRHRLHQQVQQQHLNPWSQQAGATEQLEVRTGLPHWQYGAGVITHDHRDLNGIKEKDGEQHTPTDKKRRKQKAMTATTTTTTPATPVPAANEHRRYMELEEMVARLESKLEQVTSALGDQVRLLSDSNARLLDKVKQLEKLLTTTSASPQSCDLPLSSSGTPPSPSASAFSFELSVLHSGIAPALALEARQLLPWLCHYELPGRFAVPSFRLAPYPHCACVCVCACDVCGMCVRRRVRVHGECGVR
jgi:hypothetical protein